MAMAESDNAPLFEFNVSEPEKKERSKTLDFAYWTYHVYTKTTLPTFSSREPVCVRRYNDFVWLRDALVDMYPGCIVPPIPEKSLKGSLEKVVMMNANPLLEYRQRALRKFLVRVGAHPILCTSDVLREFLELKEEEFSKRKEVAKKKAAAEGASIGQKFKEFSFSMFGSKKQAAPAPEPAPAAASAEEEYTPAPGGRDSWEETRQYTETLEKCLLQLKDRIELLVKRRRETSVSLSDFGKSFVKIGDIENSYEEGSLPKALVDVGRHAEHLSIVYQEQADNETIQVVETINYYIGLTVAVREVIKRVQKLELTRDTAQHSLQTLMDKKTRAGGKEDDARKLDVEIANAQQKANDAADQATSVVNTFREELRRFHREKQYDIKQMLRAFVDLQLEYSTKMKNSWESVLPSVEAIKTTT